jgi:hypothetical protein
MFASILEDTHGIIFPSITELLMPVSVDASTTLVKSWLIPAGCNLPVLGLGWKLDDYLTIKDMTDSLAKVSSRAYCTFVKLLERGDVEFCLTVVMNQPLVFAVPAVSLIDQASSFLVLPDDPYPASIDCTISLSPWVDISYLYVWKDVIDIMSSKSAIDEPVAFFRFLAHAQTAPHKGTYEGTVTDPTLFPNMAYHFKAFGGWPFAQLVMQDLLHPYLVLEEAQLYPTSYYASGHSDIKSRSPPIS